MSGLAPIHGHRKKKLYNARVFNLSEPAELQEYITVMRQYGDRLLSSPPERYFSSKSESIHIFIDWMSDYTYEEEFLQGLSKKASDSGDSGEQDGSAPGSALARLAARLQAKHMPSPDPEPPTEETEHGAGDPEQP